MRKHEQAYWTERFSFSSPHVSLLCTDNVAAMQKLHQRLMSQNNVRLLQSREAANRNAKSSKRALDHND
jgi:hypothetical protein